MRVISYGGGVQSTALLVLATQGRIGHIDAALFANVGDDSEHPATLDYVRTVAAPWAAERGLTVNELCRVGPDSKPRTLLHLLATENTPSIPVRLGPTAAPANRSCTKHFKVKVVERWLRDNGARKDRPADVLIGISTDEIHRVNANAAASPVQRREYPLIELGLNRDKCASVIADAGLPVPPKSACWFCPFTKPEGWAEMRRDEPHLFFAAADLEASINQRRKDRGGSPVFLTRLGKPLADAIGEAQDMLPGFGPDVDTCDEGYCWT